MLLARILSFTLSKAHGFLVNYDALAEPQRRAKTCAAAAGPKKLNEKTFTRGLPLDCCDMVRVVK